jgi:hypothetical protein
MATLANEFDMQLNLDTRLAFDQRLRRGTRQAARPIRWRLEAWLAAGRALAK